MVALNYIDASIRYISICVYVKDAIVMVTGQ